jgi:hypothetical protein
MTAAEDVLSDEMIARVADAVLHRFRFDGTDSPAAIRAVVTRVLNEERETVYTFEVGIRARNLAEAAKVLLDNLPGDRRFSWSRNVR